jgi:hypothetical protein
VPEAIGELPDPALIGLLRAVARGETGATDALADWLQLHHDPRAEQVRTVVDLDAGHCVWQVWQLLAPNLSTPESGTLYEFLGINPPGVAPTIEELARDSGTSAIAIRHGVNLALHKFCCPSDLL